MKLVFGSLFFAVVCLRLGAAEPAPFADEAFRLEKPGIGKAEEVPGVRLLLPVGPVRVDYGVPLQKLGPGHGSPLLDAPGRGYRGQRARTSEPVVVLP